MTAAGFPVTCPLPVFQQRGVAAGDLRQEESEVPCLGPFSVEVSLGCCVSACWGWAAARLITHDPVNSAARGLVETGKTLRS